MFNPYRKDCIRLVIPGGAKINDTSVLLEGDYAEGRSLALFYGMPDVKSKGEAWQPTIKKPLRLPDKI